MAWEIVKGPRPFDKLEGFDTDGGWAYDLERAGERRTITVMIAGGRSGSAELPDDCRTAIRTSGRSAVDAVRDRDTPPRYLMVTTTGIAEQDA